MEFRGHGDHVRRAWLDDAVRQIDFQWEVGPGLGYHWVKRTNFVFRTETGGNYQAQAGGASASGAYQIVNGTWDGYGGYTRARDAPPEVQDAKAAEMEARSAEERALAAKLRLFQLLPDDAVGVVNLDDRRGPEFAAAARRGAM